MKKRYWLLLLLLILTVAGWWALKPARVSDNVLVINADIITMSTPSRANALWINNGRIHGVGDAAALRAQASGAEVIDLGGKTLMPGLIEPHTHPLATALLGATVNISGFHFSSREAILHELRHVSEKTAITPWLIAFGWDPAIVEPLAPPTLAELDEISPTRPLLILTQMMHDVYFNTAAIQALGLDKTIPRFEHAKFVVDDAGKPTGHAIEVEAINYIFDRVPPPPAGVPKLLLNRQYAKYAQAGYTTIATLGPVGRTENPVQMMRELASSPNVPVRNVVYALPKQVEQHQFTPGQGWQATQGRFKVQGVKLWSDGSPWVGGAAWREPYQDSAFTRDVLHLPPGHRAQPFLSDAAFAEQFVRYHQQGFQLAVHTQGEQAVAQVFAAMQQALAQSPRQDHRHRLEHNALIASTQLQDLSRWQMTPSFFVDHIYFYGHRLNDLVGARVARYMPVAEAFKHGHKVTLHSDSPATPAEPFRVMQTAVARQARSTGKVVGEGQRISRQQALAAMTINAAWQLGIEDEVGSLAVGKRADLVVLSANPLTADLDNIAVQATWLDGQPVNTAWLSWDNLALVWDVVWQKFFD